MINYDSVNKTVKLDNDSVEYLIYINDEGYLETVYFGKSIKNFDIDFIRKAPHWHEDANIYDLAVKQEVPYSDGFKESCAPLELSTHARRDKRGAPIIIRRPNGSFATDFLYVSHRIYRGTKPLCGLPSVHGNDCDTVEFLLKERTRELYVKLTVSLFDNCDVIVKNFEIFNKSGEDVAISRAMSMQLDLPSNSFSLVHFGGRWANERNAYQNKVVDGIQEVASFNGSSSAEENPFVFLQADGADNVHGEVIGFNLLYSGNFKFRIQQDYNKGIHITYGINDEDFEWILADGESFVTPQAAISYSGEGIDRMSRNFHDFVRNNIISYRHDKAYKPVLFNSWEGCYFDFDTKSILSYIDDAEKIGAELFVLDDGWFGRRNGDKDGLGDWYVNSDKIDLAKVVGYCHEKGMKFGIWFEPEMVNYTSDLYKAHKDYALCEEGENIFLGRHQMHLDFTRPEVVDNIYCQMKAILDKYSIDYIKWDYNRRVLEHTSSHLGAKHQGEVYHRLVLGYYSLLSRIAAEYPDIMIEGCAGGGARFDLGTLCYCPQIWTSDESNPIRRSTINYNTSLGYPLSCMGTHVNNCKLMDYKQKGLFALFGTYGYEMNPNLLSDEERAMLNETADLYKRYHKDVIENGDMYHIASPQTDNWYIVQCVSKDKSCSLVLTMNILCVKDCFRFIKLRGLDPDRKYVNNVDGKAYFGDYYMTVGINYSQVWREEFGCELIVLSEA